MGWGSWLDRHMPKRADVAVAIREQTATPLKRLGCARVYTIPPGEKLDVQVEKEKHPIVMYPGNLDDYQDLNILPHPSKKMPHVQFSDCHVQSARGEISSFRHSHCVYR